LPTHSNLAPAGTTSTRAGTGADILALVNRHVAEDTRATAA
jgi:hypothetical protein